MSYICNLCPRMCRVDRSIKTGFCGAGDKIKIARASLHYWEEPCISGKNGSGTIFFSGCQLKCCFCQNYQISAENFGKEITVKRLAEVFLELQEKKAENINLVSPTQYVPWIIKSLDTVKNDLKIPVIYNSSGYETAETIKMLDGYIDIYLPDLKYFDSEISCKYSSAPNYFEIASKAVMQMFRQSGPLIFDNGMLKKGTLIRHLVLPSQRKDSEKILIWISENFPKNQILFSLMSQYTPFWKSSEYKEINRRISTYEYDFVLDKAFKLGLNGFMQERSSAKEEYTPPFNLEGC